MDNATQPAEIGRQLAEDILKSIHIPPCPAVVVALLEETRRPEVDFSKLVKLISGDVSLAASMLKTANSPFFALRHKVDSVHQAVSVLGLKNIVQIVMGSALHQALGGDKVTMERYWDRSNFTAVVASQIAARLHGVSREDAYTFGLFHDCGIPILMQRFPDYCKAFRLGEGRNWPDFREEDRRFNTDHTVVGYLVARHWNLPDFACQAIRYHHDRLHVGHTALTLVSILQMARHLYHKMAGLPETQWHEMQAQALEELGLGEEGLTEFEEDVVDTFRQEN